MTRKTVPGHPQSNADRALRVACIHFDEQIKAFIKDTRNDQDTTHVAAQWVSSCPVCSNSSS